MNEVEKIQSQYGTHEIFLVSVPESIRYPYQNPYGGSSRIHTVVVPESIRWGSTRIHTVGGLAENIFDSDTIARERLRLGNVFGDEYCLKR